MRKPFFKYGRTVRWNKLIVITAMLVSWFVIASPSVDASADTSTEIPETYLQPVMSVSRARSLTATEARRIVSAVAVSGAVGHMVRFPTVGLTAHVRDGVDVLRLGEGWRIPMATMIAPTEFLRAVGGDGLVGAAGPGKVLMGERSAAVRGAQVGDVLTLRDIKFRKREFVVGAIVPNDFVDYGDLFITSESAAVLGGISISRITITDISTPKAVLNALAAKGFVINNSLRLRTSWDRQNPDGTLGTSSVKKLLGEFAFRPSGGAGIQIETTWLYRNILFSHRFASIGLRNNCHKSVVNAIERALNEVKAAGLSKKIDLQNSNRYGGCYVARYNRLAGTFGAPSRHAYGMAVDINTTTNAQGAIPQMDCRVVRIFRKWGFAWGGNFWPLDGMHFEYVGEPRDQIGYPSRYCPNRVAVPTTTLPTFGTTTTTTTTISTTTTSSSTTTSSTTATSSADTTLPVTSST
jgi:hypothetical protein